METAPRNRRVGAQLRSASGRTSKVIKDREAVEATVEVAGAGRLVLSVDRGGRYTLHAAPQGGQASPSAPLASGEMRAAEEAP